MEKKIDTPAADAPPPAPEEQAEESTPEATTDAVPTSGVPAQVAAAPSTQTGPARDEDEPIPVSMIRKFYTDKPICAIDIGATSVKIMQVDRKQGEFSVGAYGVATFEKGAVEDGVIVQPISLAKTIRGMLVGPDLHGSITAKRVAFTVPSAHCFIRNMTVPNVALKDLTGAVQLELEQYTPVPLKELYLDYDITHRNKDETELLVVAVPKKNIEAYLELGRLLDLEVVHIEPTINANARLFAELEESNVPTVLVDFGANSSDIMVYDDTLITATMVAGGGDTFTELMAKRLGIEKHEAHFIKTTYGLAKSLTQADTRAALGPALEQLIQEIKRIQRYYSERVNSSKQLEQIVIMGGGANMPGLSGYLTDMLRMPTRLFAPWQKLKFSVGKSQDSADAYMYTTVAGLAMLNPKELFQ